ncbi:MAG: hypothetical protein CM15mP12_8690 [Gammaproteobacteria bacterium]|nr:MAG: hypothetical protein CM15mP12_8690 [Gammaproteobacteria bacterium]
MPSWTFLPENHMNGLIPIGKFGGDHAGIATQMVVENNLANRVKLKMNWGEINSLRRSEVERFF